MATLDECKNLMQRICNLPAKEEKLKEMGISDEAISSFKEILLLFDPEANQKIRRMKEIIDYIESPKK